MSKAISVFDALPERLIRGSAREEAIAFLAAADLPSATRRRLWRSWCAATLSSVRREELARVAPPAKPRERQLSLFEELEHGEGE